MQFRAPAIRPVPYRKFTVEQEDVEDPERVATRPLPPVCIEAGRLIYDVDWQTSRRSHDWKHGVERVDRHPLWLAADLTMVSRKAILKHIAMAWDCRIPRVTPPGASAGLVVTLERDIRMPPRRRYTQVWASQIAFLPGDRGYLLHRKPTLTAVLAEMVVGVGFMAETLTPEDDEALSSLG